MQRGEVWWADLDEPQGSGPGYRRPVLVVQADAFNDSRIGTVVVAALSSNLALAAAPGNVRLARKGSQLPRESVINVSQVLTLDRDMLSERITRLSRATMQDVDRGLRLVLTL